MTVVYSGFMDTPMGEVFDCPRAPPQLVAERSLDGMLAGKTSVFPDLYARMAEDCLLTKMPRDLDAPDSVINDRVAAFLRHPEAGT